MFQENQGFFFIMLSRRKKAIHGTGYQSILIQAGIT